MGFVCDELVDGIPHIWQVAVHPGDDRQCLGRALVKAARQWARTEGFGAITLTTYRDVPRNGPFYGSLGFVTLDASLPGYRQSVSMSAPLARTPSGLGWLRLALWLEPTYLDCPALGGEGRVPGARATLSG